jgi:hypothetical protein
MKKNYKPTMFLFFMHKNIIVLVSALIALSFLILYHFGFVTKITGHQVFSDSDFEKPAGYFKPSSPTKAPILLSPGECQIVSIYPANASVSRNSFLNIEVTGQYCDNYTLKISVFDKDLFFDDFLGTFSTPLIQNKAYVNISMDSTYDHFFNFFEGDQLELYFKTEVGP